MLCYKKRSIKKKKDSALVYLFFHLIINQIAYTKKMLIKRYIAHEKNKLRFCIAYA